MMSLPQNRAARAGNDAGGRSSPRAAPHTAPEVALGSRVPEVGCMADLPRATAIVVP